MGIVLGFGTGPNAIRANNRAMKALTEGCDPGPMLEACKGRLTEKLLDAAPKVYIALVTNAVEAFLADGQGEAALAVLEQIPPEPGLPAVHTSNWLYRSRTYRQLYRWDEAVEAQNRAMDSFQRGGAGPKTTAILQWLLCLNGSALRLHQGLTDGLEDQLLQLVASAPDAWRRVEAHLLLGQFYLASDRADQAREHLNYAVAHGNQLYAKKEAEELLRALDGQEPSPEMRAQAVLRRVNAAVTLSVQTCDFTPVPYLCRAALADPCVSGNETLCVQLRANICVTLINLGRYDEAEAELEQVQAAVLPDPLHLLYLQIVLDTNQGRLAQATDRQNQAMALFRETRAEAWRKPLCRTGCTLQIKLGHLDGVEERAKWLLNSAEDEFSRVTAHMLLAQYLLAAGRPEEAGDHLRYVAEHGGAHHFRAEAAKLLEEGF